MNGERATAPAVEAEQMVPTAAPNPLLSLVSSDPDDALTLIQELRQLEATPLSARWVDELLDDPRLAGLPPVREEAVRTLLEFGHPHALLINPDHLAQFRKKHPSDIRPRRLAAGAGVGLVLSLLGFVGSSVAFVEPRVTLLLALFGALVVGTVWSGSVFARAAITRGLTRAQMIQEVVVTLGLAATLAALHGTVALGLLLAVVPVALAGLAGGWSER